MRLYLPILCAVVHRLMMQSERRTLVMDIVELWAATSSRRPDRQPIGIPIAVADLFLKLHLVRFIMGTNRMCKPSANGWSMGSPDRYPHAA